MAKMGQLSIHFDRPITPSLTSQSCIRWMKKLLECLKSFENVRNLPIITFRIKQVSRTHCTNFGSAFSRTITQRTSFAYPTISNNKFIKTFCQN